MNSYGPQQLANAVRTVRKNTILVAEDIPEESYGYRVTPDSRSRSTSGLVSSKGTRSPRWTLP